MAGRQANVLAPAALKSVLRSVKRHHADPDRSTVMILLSVKAGLRVAEIAKLEWSMVLTARGTISDSVVVPDNIAKKGTGRRVPMHRDLRSALTVLRLRTGSFGPVILSARGDHLKPNSIVNWFIALYRQAGLDGCSSHSGRRTFITNAARLSHKANGSLRDVQILAGHRSLTTTEIYIIGDEPAQRRLISLL
jgi:integrase/recombinase XerD